MTLNQLALKIWEQLGFTGIDSSVLSKILSGQRLFTTNQLRTFCHILHLDQVDTNYLYECLFFDMSNRFGFKQDFYDRNDKFYLELLTQDLRRVELLESQGNLHELVDWVDDILEVNQEKLQTHLSNKTQKAIQNISAQMLRIHTDSFLAAKSKNAIAQKFKNYVILLSLYGKNLNNPTFQNLGVYQLGNYFYVLKNYGMALKVFKKVDDQYLPEFERLNYLRVMANCLSALKRINEYSQIEQKLLKFTEHASIDNQGVVFEGLGKSNIFLGNISVAENLLQKTRQVFNDSQKKGGIRIKIRKIQIIRTEALFAKATKKINPDYYSKIKKEALSVSREIGFKRFDSEIKSFLSD